VRDRETERETERRDRYLSLRCLMLDAGASPQTSPAPQTLSAPRASSVFHATRARWDIIRIRAMPVCRSESGQVSDGFRRKKEKRAQTGKDPTPHGKRSAVRNLDP
jgi:hypothetical protein